MKGIIALDIDGTITADFHTISPPVSDYLKSLAKNGWKLIFITGRTFTWSYRALHTLDFPFSLAIQNGAIVLNMPSRDIIFRKYLDKSIIPILNQASQNEPSGFVIYSGYEHHDHCYYLPSQFSQELLNYLDFRVKELKEHWIPLTSFDELPISSFPSFKFFGSHASMKRIQDSLLKEFPIHIPIVKDPLGGEDSFVAQGTDPKVTKGCTLQDFAALHHNPRHIIAAGDDLNDESMLKVATLKVVMSTAPQVLLDIANIIAPPANADGIIEGLNQAIERSTLK